MQSDKSEQNSEEEERDDLKTLTGNENFEDDWLNPGTSGASQKIDMVPTAYPVISNRLDTREGKKYKLRS